MNGKPLVAVVGGGIAGQSAASVLSAAGALVTVFDKAQGAGGRLATRREGACQWDVGAQYFTVRDPVLRALMVGLAAEGAVAPWEARVGTLGPDGFVPETGHETRYVGTPRMGALVAALGSGATVYGIDVREVAPRGPVLTLKDRHGEHFGPYDSVVVATPAGTAVPLLAVAPALGNAAAMVETAPCWALMLAFAAPLDPGFDAATVDPTVAGGALAWIARDGSKPGRSAQGGDQWVVHAAPGWSRTHAEASPAEVAAELLDAFRAALGTGRGPVVAISHFWPEAQTLQPAGVPHLLDVRQAIGACGDWCLGARIEAAFLSGRSLGEAMAARLGLAQAA